MTLGFVNHFLPMLYPQKQADFSLFAHIQGYQPTLLISRAGARLKPTRINTYQEIIELLKNPNFKLTIPKPSIVKK
ncbi:hypothetical protein CRYPA_1676 [uncultured Candidatus Thioglobus sp.]|nr:hypothetical protein CRYPA_1676 [uncultured Candidatus Thioglobus sp.]